MFIIQIQICHLNSLTKFVVRALQERECDLANPNPEYNNELDDENIPNPIYTKSPIQQKQGVFKEKSTSKNPIIFSIMGRQNVGKSSQYFIRRY